MSNSESNKIRGAAEVASKLRSQIKGDSYHHRDRLPSERILSEELGVSRGTVREALNRLEKENLVEIRPGSGTYVVFQEDLSGAEIIGNARPLELIDTRFGLEPHICRLSVLHARDQDLARLNQLCDQMDESYQDARRFSDLDTQFHLELVKSTGNGLLIWIITQINAVRAKEQWARMRRLTLDGQIIKSYNSQHRQILQSIESRDPERAAKMMKDHLETARRSLTRATDT